MRDALVLRLCVWHCCLFIQNNCIRPNAKRAICCFILHRIKYLRLNFLYAQIKQQKIFSPKKNDLIVISGFSTSLVKSIAVFGIMFITTKSLNLVLCFLLFLFLIFFITFNGNVFQGLQVCNSLRLNFLKDLHLIESV